MIWSTNWSPSISLRRAAGVCFLAGFLALGLLPVAAQDVEQRYKQAIDLFNKPDMEGACELLQQLDPGYKQTKMYMNMACSQVKRLITMEENLFNQGVQFFNQGDYASAKEKLEQAAKVALRNPPHRSEISRFLKQIDARENEERLFEEGVRALNEKKYADAESRFSQVAQGGGPKAAQARNYLAQVQAELRKQAAAGETNRLFDDGVRLMNAGRNADALTNFEKVVRAGGPNAAAAQAYIQRLRQISQPPPPSKPTDRTTSLAARGRVPGGHEVPDQGGTSSRPSQPVASEQTLRAGLQAYFQGNLEEAERSLSDYLSNNGQKQALAYFFRGAAHSTRYFLSGETNSQQKELAVADFRALKQRAGQFQPPQKYVSPKILALYSETVGAP